MSDDGEGVLAGGAVFAAGPAVQELDRPLVLGFDRPPVAAPARGPAASWIKRAFDQIAALLILLFVLPLLAVIALAIALDSPGPILFVQRRTGLNGIPIRVFKFRSMTADAGAPVRHARRDDRRITRVGGFLRRASLDELPQLFNVLRGEMSLVGPRPHALVHDRYYAAHIPDYVRRFRARPGMTGLAQISGYRGEIRSIDGMVRRVAADNLYIDRWSFWLDLKILLKTLVVAPFQGNAY
jgi:putative colanic acid biosynthesis UDP-glucose lipid carrier transferase